MGLFNFSEEELLTFFAVLVRYSTLVAVLPIFGDRFVPGPAKILLSLAVTFVMFPALVSQGLIHPGEALVWGAKTGSIVGTIALEAMFGLVMGFTARLVFDAISFGSNLIGNFMGFAAASTFDPHQETQTQVVSEVYMTVAMMLFLALDGHHLILRSTLESYQIVGLGKAGFGTLVSQRLLDLTGQVIRFGIQIAAPIAVVLFAVNVIFGVMSKAMPQLNILVLSYGVSAIVGLFVIFFGMQEFGAVAAAVTGRIGDWMNGIAMAMAGR